MGDYKNILNGIADSRLSKKASIPDKHLMIGEAEFLVPIPLFLYSNIKTLNATALIPTNMSFESAAPNLQGATLSQNDFTKTYSLGNPLDGGI